MTSDEAYEASEATEDFFASVVDVLPVSTAAHPSPPMTAGAPTSSTLASAPTHTPATTTTLTGRPTDLDVLYETASLLRDDVAPIEEVLRRVVRSWGAAWRGSVGAVVTLRVDAEDVEIVVASAPSAMGPRLHVVRSLRLGGELAVEVAYPIGDAPAVVEAAAPDDAFAPPERRLLEAVADLTAGWLDGRLGARENDRLRADLARRAEVRRTLLEAYGRLLGGHDVGAADLVLDAALRTIPGARFGSVLVRTERGTYRYAAVRGYDAALLDPAVEIPADVVLFGRDWRSGDPFLVGGLDQENDDFRSHHPDLEVIARVSMESGAAESYVTPVVVDGALVAALNVERPADGEPFTADAGELLRLYAQNVGTMFVRAERMAHADLLARAVEATNDGIAVVDVPRRGGTAVFRVANPALLRYLGCDQGEIDRWDAVAAVGRTTLAHGFAALRKAVRTGVPSRLEVYVTRPDGSGSWVETLVSELDRDRDRVRALITLRDTTIHRAQVEELERLNDDLEVRLTESRTLEAIDSAFTGGDATTSLTRVAAVVAARPGIERATLSIFDADEQWVEAVFAAPDVPTAPSITPGIRRVRETHAPWASADATRWTDAPEGRGYRAWPLTSQGGLVGVLEVVLAESFVPDDAWTRFMGVLSGQVAIAVDNAGMLQRLRRGAAAYADLAEFSGRIEEIDDADELVDHGVRALMDAFGMGAAAYFAREGDQLRLARTWGAYAEPGGRRLGPYRADEGAIGRAVITGESVYVESYPTWPQRLPDLASATTSTVLALPVHTGAEVGHVMLLAALHRPVPLRPDQVTIARAFVRRLERALERSTAQRLIEASREEAFRSLGLALEYRDYETRGHTDRVVAMSRRFGRHLGLDEARVEALAWGAYLHDLGKLAIPDGILLKPAKPTSAEFDWAKRHADIGHQMSRDLTFLPETSREVVRSHHEHWDGSGYPDGLEGDAIPYLARVFMLVDVYDALISERPYKPAWSPAAAREEIATQSGSHFDPSLTAALLEMFDRDA